LCGPLVPEGDFPDCGLQSVDVDGGRSSRDGRALILAKFASAAHDAGSAISLLRGDCCLLTVLNLTLLNRAMPNFRAPTELVADPPRELEMAEESPSGEIHAVAHEEGMRWYVLKVQSNREKSIRDSLVRRIKREGLEDKFGDIIIPTEKVKEAKGGKTRVTERKLYPGYIMVQMILNDETWYLVRDTSGVGDFTGSAGKPSPMDQSEIDQMLGKKVNAEVEPQKIKINLARGDAVKIKEGTFESFEGTVEAIDEEHGKITVLIEIFGRSTPVELEYWQAEKV
jgi:transcriptional antiterminator NusG